MVNQLALRYIKSSLLEEKKKMFSTSSQQKYWMFSSLEELDRLRKESNEEFIKRQTKRMGERKVLSKKIEFLTPAEEKALLTHYQCSLRDFCKNFNPPMPRSVIGTAFQYYKRFYLYNSVMDYHPKFILVTCIYLACKVDEFNVSMDQFLQNVKGNRENARDGILNHELLLMQQLKFHLTIHNPFRAIEGLFIDIKTRCIPTVELENFRRAIDERIDKTYLTDACFIFSPSQIALAAISYGAAVHGSDIDIYINSILLEEDPDKARLISDVHEGLWVIVNDAPEQPDKAQIKYIEQKLEKCRNQENNPQSQEFKEALIRQLNSEEDDFGLPATSTSREMKFKSEPM